MPLLQDEQILPPDHPLQKIITIMNNEFPVSGRDEKVRVGLYPILTLQYSSTTLYQVSYQNQSLFF
jgi:hypothetical protein